MRVTVPLGAGQAVGYVVGFCDEAPSGNLKDIIEIMDDEPLFDERDLEFFRWASVYYCYPLGLTIQTALPQGLGIRFDRTAELTDSGRVRAAGSPAKPSCDERILHELAAHGSLKANDMQKQFGHASVGSALKRLESSGLIRTAYRPRGKGVSIRNEKWYTTTGEAARLTEKQQAVFSFIAERGIVSAADLRRHLGGCTAQLKALSAKGLLKVELRELYRRPPPGTRLFSEPVHELSPGQKKILDRIEHSLHHGGYRPLLLHGVTGSGKTEVYLQVMQRILQQEKQCLYLVPEISLTSQLLDRISSRLSVPVGVLHSGLTPAERFDAWRMIRRGELRAVIGARSAVFAPFPDLGAVIVDEEHDPSFKQDDTLRYNARDLALVKAKLAGCIAVLGSATPSLESYSNARDGKYELVELPSRAGGRPMPAVHIVDMRSETGRRGKRSAVFSKPLCTAIDKRLAAGQQSILFLNRRGFSPAYLCRQCGHVFKCPNCDVSLIHHRSRSRLVCHYCDYAAAVPETCPACSSMFLVPVGWGTERLEAEVAHLFPGCRIARMDRDTASSRCDLQAIMEKLHRQEVDILIGTQMVVKGYHLPHVTLVGVLSADQSLHFPDYRSAERTFQLITQVAGRAGRGDRTGEVIVQTYNPDHYSIVCASAHDYAGFYKTESAYRRDLEYPPCGKMINVRIEGSDRARVAQTARRLGAQARDMIVRGGGGIDVLGPASAPWERIKGRYRFQMILKGHSTQRMRAVAAALLEGSAHKKTRRECRVMVDVDPVFVL